MTYVKHIPINDDQYQILLGTILGGSSLVKPKGGKNAFLCMRSKNISWLKCKAQEINQFVSEIPITKDGNYYRWHSKCSPIFNEFYTLFYKNGKKHVNMNTLDILRDIGLSVWFLDCGKMIDGKIRMRLTSFKDKSIIVKYFDEIGLHCELKGNFIYFNIDISEKFVNIIGQYIPDFMI